MVDLKFAKRLNKELTAIKPVKTHEMVANEIHMAPSTLSNIKTGKRAATREVKRSLTDAIGSLKLAISAARSEFGTQSFLNDVKLQLDSPYAAMITQHKEEQERIQAEHDFELAYAKNPADRNAEDVAHMKNWVQQYLEEMGAERTDFIVRSLAAGISESELQSMIDHYNRLYGG